MVYVVDQGYMVYVVDQMVDQGYMVYVVDQVNRVYVVDQVNRSSEACVYRVQRSQLLTCRVQFLQLSVYGRFTAAVVVQRGAGRMVFT